MKCSTFLLFTATLLSALSIQAQNKYQYSVDLTSTVNDELKVELLVPAINSKDIIFYMPKIVPGTYINSDFGKFISVPQAFDKGGKSLPVTALPDSNSWKISHAQQLYRLEYMVQETRDASSKHTVMKWPEQTLKTIRISH